MKKYKVVQNKESLQRGYGRPDIKIKPRTEYSVIDSEGIVVCDIPDFRENPKQDAELIAEGLNNVSS